MKKIFSHIGVKIAVFAALALFILFGIVIPYRNSVQRQTKSDIGVAVSDVFTYPDVDNIERLERYMKTVQKNRKNREAFEAQGVEQIRKSSRSLTFLVYDIAAQQVILETFGFESPAIKAAQEEKIRDAFARNSATMEMDHFIADIINEPVDEEKIYDISLSYYVSPQDILREEFLPAYFAQTRDTALTSGKTSEILSLCNALSQITKFDVVDVEAIVPIEQLLTILTTGAEEITVKPGAGGYYDLEEDASDSSHKKDELFDFVVDSIFGTGGESTFGKVETVEYFGDLASLFYTKTFHYQWTDEDGNTQTTTQDSNTRRTVLLKGQRINESYLVNEKHIKYAYEDGMVSYHKDGHCFAIGNGKLTCFVGEHSFLLEY